MAWLYKRDTVWWIGWRANGKQYLESTGETEREKAEVHFRKIESIIAAQKSNSLTDQFYETLTGRKFERVTASKFFSQWITESEPNVSRSSILKYRQVVREFSAFAGVESKCMMLDDITVTDLAGFFADCRKRLAAGTVKGYRRILGSIFLQAQNRGLIRGNPVALAKARGKAAAADRVQKRPFTLAELKSLHSKANDFWKYMIECGYFTGQSLGDLIMLTAEIVDMKSGLITMHRRKSGTQVIIPISKPLRATLDNIWPRGGKGYFWPEQAALYLKVKATPFSQEFYELMFQCGMVPARDPKKKSKGRGRGTRRELTGLGFHNVRHTFVTALKVGGAVDSVARELAGHRSNAVSAVYTHLPIETLSHAVAQLPEFV